MLTPPTAVLFGVLLAWNLAAACPEPYPNEIDGLRFYAPYLAPLRPGHSDTKEVVRVLGSDQGLDLNDWRIHVYFSCKGDVSTCTHEPYNRPLDSIKITPKRRIRFNSFRLPEGFSYSSGTVSEINIACNVYSDDSGLEYWVVARGHAGYRKGDVFMIRYGPSPGGKTGDTARTGQR